MADRAEVMVPLRDVSMFEDVAFLLGREVEFDSIGGVHFAIVTQGEADSLAVAL